MSVTQQNGSVWCPKGEHFLSRNEFYEDPKSSNGLSSYCKKCHASLANAYYHNNRDECMKKMRARHRANRELCFQHYGRKCACCGESRYEFLALDHIFGRGREHRDMVGNKLCRWLIKNNFPPGFRTLCHNCNSAIGYFGYCPHELEKEASNVEGSQS